MNIYRVLGDRIGTIEARELAEQLVAWHDAMVKHLRVVSSRSDATCVDDCPHGEAALLWAAAQHTFGTKAKDLTFLRSHGQRLPTSSATRSSDHAAEIHA
jgi:hypothetical protein